jgi:hypothetical protein
VLASTSRISPLPGLTQASSTPAVFVVANLTMGTAVTSKASAANAPITVRRIQLLVISFSSLSRAAAPHLKWKGSSGEHEIYSVSRLPVNVFTD